MNIGISAWGYLNPGNGPDSPDGGRSHRPMWVKKLLDEGHNIYWLQENRDGVEIPEWAKKIHYEYAGFKNFNETVPCPFFDAVIFEWRWEIIGRNTFTIQDIQRIRYAGFDERIEIYNEFSKKSEFQPDLVQQWNIIDHCRRLSPVTKLIFWDKDLKLTPMDLEQGLNVELCVPAYDIKGIEERLGGGVKYNQLFFPVDFQLLSLSNQASDMFSIPWSYNRNIKVCYIGNDYERDSMFEKYMIPVAKEFNHKIHIVGNWKKKKESGMLNDFVVHNRKDYKSAFEFLCRSGTTIHLMKDEYAKYGFVAPRIFEALLANVPAFIPDEFKFDGLSIFNDDIGGVESFVNFIESTLLTQEDRKHVMNSQKESFMWHCRSTTMNLEEWYNEIIRLVRK